MNSDRTTALSLSWPSSRFITVTAARSAIVCSRECESIMRIARVFDLPSKVRLSASLQPRNSRDERPIAATAVGAAAAITPVNDQQTLDKPVLTDHHQPPPPPQQQQQQPQQQQQHIWTQGFEKLLEDPLGLRAFAVSIPFYFLSLFLLYFPSTFFFPFCFIR